MSRRYDKAKKEIADAVEAIARRHYKPSPRSHHRAKHYESNILAYYIKLGVRDGMKRFYESVDKG